jgi:hypothetical protein
MKRAILARLALVARAGALLPALSALACSSAPDAAAPPSTDGDAGQSGSADASSSPGADSASDTSLESGSPALDAISPPQDGATPPLDAPIDAPAPTCGPPPTRYTVLSGADAGLARDNTTMLVWMQDSHGAGEPPQTQSLAVTYCTGRGMRLPTKAEALALAASYAPCAFGTWGTWTSTAAAGAGYDWVVDYTGGASPQLADNFPSAVLCVRDPGGG